MSKQYILEKVVYEPLLKNNLKCLFSHKYYTYVISHEFFISVITITFLGNFYVIEALHFHLLKSVNPFTNPKTVWSTPRHSEELQKV